MSHLTPTEPGSRHPRHLHLNDARINGGTTQHCRQKKFLKKVHAAKKKKVYLAEMWMSGCNKVCFMPQLFPPVSPHWFNLLRFITCIINTDISVYWRQTPVLFFFLQKLETVYDWTAHKAFFFVISATQSAASRAEKIQMIFLRKTKVASGLSEKHPVVRWEDKESWTRCN